MPSIRIGFTTDFNLVREQVGIGTTFPSDRLDVRGQILSDNSAGSGGVSTITRYDGFLNKEQRLADNVSIGQTTKGNLNSISGEIVIPSGKEITVSSGTPIAAGRLDSLTVTNAFDLPHGGTLEREETPEKGSTRFNQDLGQLEFYTGTEWRTAASYDGSGRGRGVWAGGQNPTRFTTIDYVNIHSTGNAINFGDLITAREFAGGQPSSSIRGLFGGGELPGGTYSNVIEYITTASQGNAISFGTLSETRKAGAAFSSSTRGIWASGRTPVLVNTIDYVEISTLGNALDFGDSIIAASWRSGFSSPTRGVFAGGGPVPTTFSIIEFVTMSSKGNSLYFGDLVEKKQSLAGFSNSLRGFIVGGFNAGSTNTDTIEYVTISTLGNGQDFGNLSTTRRTMSGSATQTRGVFGAGETPFLNIIEYITLSTAGNAQDFGDLTIARASCGSCSDSHGGLGGF